MAMAAGGTAQGAKANINVTPLIDVLLVLLIIFMAITPLSPTGEEVMAPHPSDRPGGDARTVAIVIDRYGNMKINGEATDEFRLGARLAEIFSTRAERVVFVKGDKSLDYQVVAKAIDIAHGAGIDKIGLLTPKIEEGL